MDPTSSVHQHPKTVSSLEPDEEAQQHQEIHYAKGTTFSKTCFNMLNALSGIGILSISYALSEAGWAGLALLFLVAIVCCYTGILLQRCMDTDTNIQTYPDIADRAFGYYGQVILSVFFYLELYLVAIEFLILEGDNLAKLFPSLSFEVAGWTIERTQGFIILSALIILPTAFLRSLDLLAYVSASGILASLVVIASVTSSGLVDGVGFHSKGRALNPSGIPSAISLFAFCYCGHAVFPTICSSMKDRTKFSKVLILSFTISTLIYGSMGILGYLMYGEEVKSQVTLNLPNGKLSSKIAIYTTLINPFTKYALVVTPIASAIEDALPSTKSSSFFDFPMHMLPQAVWDLKDLQTGADVYMWDFRLDQLLWHCLGPTWASAKMTWAKLEGLAGPVASPKFIKS
ncbi:hypothetical protein AMTR_s00010p00251810 [Amborella trichopoda]|uniref:Amino acid transporter transmembrane domain-containing protein n=1 Tax=Amborella trichopoda TaxID=13333 RepID=W1NFX2_AMBTC|nr:hypothetical protein AMTR_s00010p00251810 [Amborella trichopoda]